MCVCVSEWVSEWVSECLCVWVSESACEWAGMKSQTFTMSNFLCSLHLWCETRYNLSISTLVYKNEGHCLKALIGCDVIYEWPQALNTETKKIVFIYLLILCSIGWKGSNQFNIIKVIITFAKISSYSWAALIIEHVQRKGNKDQ